MHRPRIAILALALAALVVIALPASALAGGKSHHLVLYKAEKQVDLDAGDSVSASVSCNPGDYAMDGMWRIDHVDQANAQIPGADKFERDIQVQSARSTAVGTYSFDFINPSAAQRAQLKIFVTCLGQKTAPDTHSHGFTISAQMPQSYGPVGPGIGFGFHSTDCPVGTIAVAPGYSIDTGSGRVVGSRSSLGGGEPPLMRNWSMAFVFDAPSTWTITYRCLTLKSSVVNAHTHSIIPRFSPSPLMNQRVLGGNSTSEVQEVCGEHEKGLIHAFDTDGASAQHLYFLGMDPRIKARAYRFENTSGGPINVGTGLVCFNDRTT